MVKAGNIAPFEVTYGDTGLFVMATIKQVTSGGLVPVTTVEMQASNPGTYYGYFVPPAGFENAYLITINAYTDNTYTTVNQNYDTSSRGETSVILSGSSPSSSPQFVQGPLLGLINQDVSISATITQDEEISI